MTAHDILRAIADEHGLTLAALKSRCRKSRLVEARAQFVRRVASCRDLTDAQIGRVINRTSHTARYYRVEEYRERKKKMCRERRRAERASR